MTPSDSSTPDGSDATVLYFVRHGETEYNRKGIIQGSGIDSSLNETGRRQARALARRFAHVSIDAVYASTLTRARQTADIVAERLPNVDRGELDDLKEMAWGVFEGRPPSDERDTRMDAIKATWQAGSYGQAIEGGESILDVQTRADRAARHLVDREAGRTALVVTHGRFLRVLLASICDGYDLSHMSTLGHANTCVNRVVHRDGIYHAELLNCTAHLTADASHA